MTALSLQAFAIGLVGFSYVKILAPAYFAREDTRTPVRIALIALLVNFVLSVTLAAVLTHYEFVGTHAGLALAISIAALLNAALLYRGLRRDGIIHHSTGWPALILRCAVANVVMAIAVLASASPLQSWLEATVVERVGWLFAQVAIGAVAYILTLLVLGVRPANLKLHAE